jgi:hypothetical protein
LDLKEVRRSCLEKASFAWCRSIRGAEFCENLASWSRLINACVVAGVVDPGNRMASQFYRIRVAGVTDPGYRWRVPRYLSGFTGKCLFLRFSGTRFVCSISIFSVAAFNAS